MRFRFSQLLGVVALFAVGFSCPQAGAAPFAPTDLSGLQVWFDAERDVTTDGSGFVTSWGDQSVNNRDASGSGTARPLLVADVIAGHHDAVRFDGTNDSLVLPAFAQEPTQSATIFVWTTNVGVQGGTFLAKYNGGVNVGLDFFADSGGVNGRIGNTAGGFFYRAIGDDVRGSAEPHVASMTYFAQSQVDIHVDGVIASDTTSEGSISPDQSGVSFTIGSIQGERFLAGDIAEVIVYNRALDATERGQVEAYFASQVVPEPGSLALVALGGLVLSGRRRARG